MFLSYLKRNPADPNKIWCVLSWVNSSCSSINVFHLTWIVSLHYVVKLNAFTFCKRTAIIGTVNRETPTKMFFSHQKLLFSHLVVISIVDVNTGVIVKPHHFQCVKNFKFKATHSRRLCHLRAKHECYVLQDSVETLVMWGEKRLVMSWQI